MTAAAIEPVDVHGVDQFNSWYDVLRAGALAGRTLPLMPAREEMRADLHALLRQQQPRRLRFPWVARLNGVAAGALVLELPMTENPHVALIQLAVPPEHRGLGVGAALLAHALSLSVDAGRTTMVGEVHLPVGVLAGAHAGCRFVVSHGFAVVQTDEHQVLGLPIDPAVLDRLSAVGGDGRSEYRFLSWTGHCPDEHVDAFASMKTGLQRDIPMGEMDIEPAVWLPAMVREQEDSLVAQRVTAFSVAAMDNNAEFVAYTQLFVPFHQPEEALQNDTFVVPAHRGRGLGAAMKAINLSAVSAAFPERHRVHTWTASDNGPMLKVNAGFGFRTVEHTLEYQRPLV